MSEPRDATVVEGGPIVLFDGECNLCNGWVRFVTRRERAPVLRFASLQSEAGERLLRRYRERHPLPDSIAVLEGDRLYLRSQAVFRIVRELRAPWPLLAIFRVVPRPLRDAVYDLVARWRFRLFGRAEACPLPSPELRGRFLS